ncbi:sulfotransferase family protein [Cognatishimia maritima]|uniref:Sulfotransferase family protein n=1 Tax=Cognatishimia maritima TaxID=870908 RepID=A0A1M5WFB8_9RHOB|nr:sulfotransferase [Cognatishimia maritima]SHH86249.1 Sulfotransferase family protein [Cognatishimia maritima]
MEFCVVGTGRCGSKLLRSMFNYHPDLFVFNETHWFAKLHEWFGTAQAAPSAMLDVIQRSRHVDGSTITEVDSARFLTEMNLPDRLPPADFCDALGRYFARQHGKTLWADKTPDYGYMASTLQIHWPKCKVIHLIRDGAAVAQSMSKHPGYQALAALGQRFWCPLSLDFPGIDAPDTPPDMARYSELWHDRLTRIRNEATRLSPGSYLEVRHEDILASPQDNLDKVARFTGLRSPSEWQQQAETLINPKIANKPRPTHVLSSFAPHHLTLMRELGYPADSDHLPC